MLDTPSVIIAEDDLVFALILQRFLEKLGFCISSLSQTEDQVVELGKSEHPDFIILDVHLKKGNGLIAHQRIRQFSETPILILTGSTPDVIPDLTGLDYLVKPFLVNDLKAKIFEMLNRHQQQANS